MSGVVPLIIAAAALAGFDLGFSLTAIARGGPLGPYTLACLTDVAVLAWSAYNLHCHLRRNKWKRPTNGS